MSMTKNKSAETNEQYKTYLHFFSYPWNNFVGVDGTLLLTGTVDDDEEFVDDGEEITGTDLCSKQDKQA